MKTRQYNNGDTCSVSANPGSHYTFDGWFENDSIVSSDNPYSFTVSGNRTLEGKFTANSYTITTNVSPVSSGSISGGGTYDYGDTCTLTATPNQDYRFATWTDGDGNFLSNDNPFSFTVSGDLTVRGVFGEYVAPPSILITTTGPASFTLTNSNNQTYTWVLSSGDNYYYGDEPGFALDEITGIRRVGANNTTVISADISELTSMTALSIEAFDTCKNLESIVLPDSLTTIEMNAFWGCNNLETINLPNSLTSIGDGAFSDCTSLTSITLPNSLTSIGIGAFGGCTNLTSINIPNSITFIGNNAFASCSSLTSITLPNSLTTLEYGVFQGSGLTSITIPSSITTWSSDVFYNCTSLESITIPEGITAIGPGSFDTCESLTSTTLPASLTNINDGAFYGCISQESITSLATTPPTLGYDVFTDDSGCNIYVPWSADHSVYNSYVSSWSTYSSRIVEMPNPTPQPSLKITTSGSTSVILTNSSNQTYTWNLSSGLNEYFGDEPGFALDEITGIRRVGANNTTVISVDISELTSMTTLPIEAFDTCKNLESVVLPDSLTTIGEYAFSNCYYLGGYQTTINFPDSLTTIGTCAFYGCSRLESVDLSGTSITTIGERVFMGCTGLTSINLSDSLTTIRFNAFGGCTGLTSITLPDTLTTLIEYAFSGSGLTSINIPENVSSIGIRTFGNCQDLASITVDSNNQYYNDGNGSNCIIETATNTLIVGCKNTVIPNTVVEIDDGAFYGSTGLTSITLPNSITTIGVDVFGYCTGLTSITLPSSLTTIRFGSFYGCTGLTSITIPASVSSIGTNPFSLCGDTITITVDSNNQYYNDGNGSNCIIETATNTLIVGCKNTVIPNTVVSIGVDAFMGCYSLASITLPASITSIGTWAFIGCKGLTSITCLATTPPTLGNNVFFNTNNCPIYVPAASLSAYQSAWSEYSSRLNAL